MRRIRRKPKYKKPIKFRYKINQFIKDPYIILIDEENNNIGKISTGKALKMAQEKGLDLVEVQPKADPSICKIMDYGKLKYKMEKKQQKQRNQSKKYEIKGIRLSFRISKHDLEFRLEQAKKFLEKGNKLKIEMTLRGREKAHLSNALEIIKNFINSLKNIENFNIIEEQPLTKENGKLTAIIFNKN